MRKTDAKMMEKAGDRAPEGTRMPSTGGTAGKLGFSFPFPGVISWFPDGPRSTFIFSKAEFCLKK